MRTWPVVFVQVEKNGWFGKSRLWSQDGEPPMGGVMQERSSVL